MQRNYLTIVFTIDSAPKKPSHNWTSDQTASSSQSITTSGSGNAENNKPKYSFSYTVNNEETQDFKTHSETRDGDYLQGEYSLLDPDGYMRVVTYSYDPVQGFKKTWKRFFQSNKNSVN